MAQASQGSGKQSTATVTRITELGKSGLSVVDIDRTLHRELEPFLARTSQRGQPAPRFVEQTLRAYLRCGVLAHGFLRLHCDACQQDRLVPFSCKRRGVCPSCQPNYARGSITPRAPLANSTMATAVSSTSMSVWVRQAVLAWTLATGPAR